jgi:phosphate starvation-inducible membrane PsiE
MSFCIFTSGLYMLNKSIIRKITNLFRKKKRKITLFKTSLFNLLKAYLFVCLPMVILAAFTETYIADMLFKLNELDTNKFSRHKCVFYFFFLISFTAIIIGNKQQQIITVKR